MADTAFTPTPPRVRSHISDSEGTPCAEKCKLPDRMASTITEGPASLAQLTLRSPIARARAWLSISCICSIAISGMKMAPNCCATAISFTSYAAKGLTSLDSSRPKPSVRESAPRGMPFLHVRREARRDLGNDKKSYPAGTSASELGCNRSHVASCIPGRRPARCTRQQALQGCPRPRPSTAANDSDHEIAAPADCASCARQPQRHSMIAGLDHVAAAAQKQPRPQKWLFRPSHSWCKFAAGPNRQGEVAAWTNR